MPAGYPLWGTVYFSPFEHDPQRYAMTIEVLEGFPVHRTTSVGGLVTRAPVSRPLAGQPLPATAGYLTVGFGT